MKKSQFTLIELLVVIGIIGILLGILLPTVASTMHSSKKHKAQNYCNQIAFACNAYMADFSSLPLDDGSKTNDETFDVDTNLQLALFGIDPDVVIGTRPDGSTIYKPMNARSKKYLETEPKVKMLNPWGKPYQIIIDYDYNNTLNPVWYDKTLGARVGVWTETDQGEILISWGKR